MVHVVSFFFLQYSHSLTYHLECKTERLGEGMEGEAGNNGKQKESVNLKPVNLHSTVITIFHRCQRISSRIEDMWNANNFGKLKGVKLKFERHSRIQYLTATVQHRGDEIYQKSYNDQFKEIFIIECHSDRTQKMQKNKVLNNFLVSGHEISLLSDSQTRETI